MKKVTAICSLVLTVVLTVGLFSGCGGSDVSSSSEASSQVTASSDVSSAEQTESDVMTPPTDIKQIMSKTPADFAGNKGLVELGINEEGKENFVVYQETVTHAATQNGENVVLEADIDEGVYVIQNPSEEIRSLSEGEVFVIPSTPENPVSAAVKIETVTETAEDTFTYESEPVGVEDLYTYAYIETPMYAYSFVPPTQPAKEGTVDLFGYSDDPSDRVMLTENGVRNESYDQAVDWRKTLTVGASVVLPYHVSFGTGTSNGISRDFRCEGELRLTLTEITVFFYCEPEAGLLRFGISYDTQADADTTFFREGGWGDEWNIPIPLGTIPGTPIPVTMQVFLNASVIGGIGGTVSVSQSYTNGMNVTLSAYAPAYCEGYSRETGFTGDLDLEVRGKGEIYGGVRLGIGFPGELELYGELGVLGVKLEGSIKADAVDLDQEAPDSIHDCEICVDGTYTVFGGRGRVGYNAALVGNAIGHLYEKLWEASEHEAFTGAHGYIDLFETELDRKDFYASLRKKDSNDFDFGWGDCPHRRYRVHVYVQDENGSEIENAKVNARYPDFRMDVGRTSAEGEVVFYLPNGDNLLEATYGSQSGDAHALVDGAVTTATVKLKGRGSFYINYPGNEQGNDNDSYPELYQKLCSMFPDANVCDGGSVEQMIADGILQPGDIVLDVKYGAPEQEYGEWKDDNLSDGDDSNIWGESGGWVYIEARRVFGYEDGSVNSHRYFSFDVTYDGPYKAWPADPKPIGNDAFRLTTNSDVSALYYGMSVFEGYADSGTTQQSNVEYLSHPYSTDVNSIYALPSQRNMIVSQVGRLQGAVEAMLEGADLMQQFPVF